MQSNWPGQKSRKRGKRVREGNFGKSESLSQSESMLCKLRNSMSALEQIAAVMAGPTQRAISNDVIGRE